MKESDSVPVDSYVDSISHYSLSVVNTDRVICEIFSIFAMGNEMWILRIANCGMIPSTFRPFNLRLFWYSWIIGVEECSKCIWKKKFWIRTINRHAEKCFVPFSFFIQTDLRACAQHKSRGHTRSVLAIRWFDLDWTIHLWKKKYRDREKYSYMI